MKTLQKRHPLLKLAVAVAVAGVAASAAAQDNQFGQSTGAVGSGVQLIDGSTFDLILASFARNGFDVELTTDSEGAPLIKSTKPGEPFSVYFYSCRDNTDCGFIQFTTGWNLEDGITLAKVDEWNATKVWGQAFRDDEKDPWLSMAVNLKGGVTVENFDDTVDWWKVILREFEKHIGWDE
jgi:hypothetical protein